MRARTAPGKDKRATFFALRHVRVGTVVRRGRSKLRVFAGARLRFSTNATLRRAATLLGKGSWPQTMNVTVLRA
jgi:hypothetical protein